MELRVLLNKVLDLYLSFYKNKKQIHYMVWKNELFKTLTQQFQVHDLDI